MILIVLPQPTCQRFFMIHFLRFLTDFVVLFKTLSFPILTLRHCLRVKTPICCFLSHLEFSVMYHNEMKFS